jgi:cytochrome b6-f complex iron-sulfur subunit
MESKNFNRRDFIKSSFKTIAVGSLALSAIDVKKILASEPLESTGIQQVINLSDYPALGSVGGSAMISDKVIVIRSAGSKFIALNITCTHKKCEVEFDGSGFACPCHGSTYDRNGKVTNGPAKKNLRSYKTTYNEAENTLDIKM